jgi:hypothetical protein
MVRRRALLTKENSGAGIIGTDKKDIDCKIGDGDASCTGYPIPIIPGILSPPRITTMLLNLSRN